MKLISAAKLACVGLVALGGCARLDHVGKPPTFTPANETPEHVAMLYQGLPLTTQNQRTVDGASLWSGSRQSLLGDRRATKQGDILTVVIEIDEEASISNDTNRSRSASESLEVPQLLGLPQRLDNELPAGASSASAVDLGGSSSSSGSGSVSRSEKLELRVAATVVDVLPNGVLAISGSQELRVNFELRELLVTGYVRPDDISRQNEITYDKIASARVSYGGRGQITDVQQPRYGQQILDVILPF
ncbi:Basal body L-ring protein [Tritonibacter multivorans]|uniref:Flagellar L-ring protein n=1 Tax=Tritonibacter multivorans TaxID=928856 RepID=A0A0P1GE21_9RHOB|nr:flagellar basal body L-ring protein FlgH [Tritonibacter multivorans]MDA7420155.1 flagellar basal body L-ring protein FlgH [Tritonibacter multivorans]CUH79795.1 Basal body L-ring protein [Tritonibacter multivorans]SFC02325.1 flagellar L-ring protein precursor FlgH [Tritonibacter multivorans]